MTNQNKAYLYALATVALWSTVATAFKISLNFMEPVQLLLYASLTSVAVLGTILLVQGKIRLVLSCTPSQYLQSLGQGMLNPFLYYLVLFKAYDLLPAQVAQPLNYTWAITLAFLATVMLRQRVAFREIAAGIICFTGVVVISSRGTLWDLATFDTLGVCLALGSTVIWSLSWIYGTRDSRDPTASLFLAFVFSLPFTLAAAVATAGLRIFDMRGFMGAMYVGAFEMGITFVFWLRALKLSENTARVGNLIFLSPFLSLIFIHFIVGEEIYFSTFAGLLLIVTGLLAQGLGKKETAG